MQLKHLFILNPNAGKTDSVELMTAEINDYFSANAEEGVTYEIKNTVCESDATKIVQDAADTFDGELRVYACGGDGTLNEVISGAVGRDNVAVCPMPLGSGNDFVRCFENTPSDKFRDLASCVRGRVIPCDVMKVGDRYSVNIISVGLDAATCKKQKKLKRIPGISGSAAYNVGLGLSFMTAMKNKIRFEIDDAPFDAGSEYITIGVAGNGKYYGGGYKAAPYADVSDGLMEFVTLRTISRFEFLKYVGIYKKGEHIEKLPIVKYIRCKKIKMFADKPVTMQLDGEVFEAKDPVIELIPAATKIIIPE